jgi:hypothetical protein
MVPQANSRRVSMAFGYFSRVFLIPLYPAEARSDDPSDRPADSFFRADR